MAFGVDVSYATFLLNTLFDSTKHMGIFSIIVINDLVAPMPTTGGAPSTTNASIDVNIYMRCNDDMRFAQPVDSFQDANLIPAEPASGMQDSVEPARWTEDTVLQAQQSDSRNLVFFGETITSWRSVLKRYTKAENRRMQSSAAQFHAGRKIFPMYPAARDATATGGLRKTSLMTWVTSCYLIKRGAVRWKVLPMPFDNEGASTGAGIESGYISASRQTWSTAINTDPPLFDNNVTNGTSVASLTPYVDVGHTGMDFVFRSDRNGLEVQLPFYNDTRFLLGTSPQTQSTAANEPMVLNPASTMWHGMYVYLTGYNALNDLIGMYVAAAEDYTLHYYLAPPPIYEYS